MRRLVFALTIGASAFLAPGFSSAQVIVPPRGEGTINLVAQHYRHTGHFDKDGNKTYNTSTQSEILIAMVDFGVTDSIGLAVSVPLISSKYTGPPVYSVPPGIETHAGPLDNGRYHAAFQDLRIEARRMFVAGPVVIA